MRRPVPSPPLPSTTITSGRGDLKPQLGEQVVDRGKSVEGKNDDGTEISCGYLNDHFRDFQAAGKIKSATGKFR